MGVLADESSERWSDREIVDIAQEMAEAGPGNDDDGTLRP